MRFAWPAPTEISGYFNAPHHHQARSSGRDHACCQRCCALLPAPCAGHRPAAGRDHRHRRAAGHTDRAHTAGRPRRTRTRSRRHGPHRGRGLCRYLRPIDRRCAGTYPRRLCRHQRPAREPDLDPRVGLEFQLRAPRAHRAARWRADQPRIGRDRVSGDRPADHPLHGGVQGRQRPALWRGIAGRGGQYRQPHRTHRAQRCGLARGRRQLLHLPRQCRAVGHQRRCRLLGRDHRPHQQWLPRTQRRAQPLWPRQSRLAGIRQCRNALLCHRPVGQFRAGRQPSPGRCARQPARRGPSGDGRPRGARPRPVGGRLGPQPRCLPRLQPHRDRSGRGRSGAWRMVRAPKSRPCDHAAGRDHRAGRGRGRRLGTPCRHPADPRRSEPLAAGRDLCRVQQRRQDLRQQCRRARGAADKVGSGFGHADGLWPGRSGADRCRHVDRGRSICPRGPRCHRDPRLGDGPGRI